MHDHTGTPARLVSDDRRTASDHWERILRAASFLDSAEEILRSLRTQVEATRRLILEARELSCVERIVVEEGQRCGESLGKADEGVAEKACLASTK